MTKELLFRVSIKDCNVDTFRSGGPGGQNQNKVESGVRVTHRDSGAVGESREHRSQKQNKEAAWMRMISTPKFKAWHKLECSRRLGTLGEVEASVERAMAPGNLQVDGKVDGRWVPIEEAKEG